MRSQNGKLNPRYKHGMYGCKEYVAWTNMISRCESRDPRKYKYYGKRGITISKKWRESFESFYKDMGSAPSTKHSLDRINNNLGYCKSNCRWATKFQQLDNRRISIKITYKGKKYSIREIANIMHLPYETIRLRVSRGQDPCGHKFLKGQRKYVKRM